MQRTPSSVRPSQLAPGHVGAKRAAPVRSAGDGGAAGTLAPARRKAVDPVARLWRAWRKRGGEDERNALVEHYRPFALDIVRRFALRLPPTVDRGDLETASQVGLMQAIEGYDHERGVPFESYCDLRVRGALVDELRHMDWVPRPVRARLEQRRRVLERLRAEFEREPSDEEVAADMGMPVAEYRQFFGAALVDGPQAAWVDEEGEDAPTALDRVADENAASPFEDLTRVEILGLVAQRLSEVEYQVVYLRYWENLAMREIGEMLSLSESRVCKIHMQVLARLRERFSSSAG
ncbi:MAG: polymerase sigma factor FliA [Planctomycetota bacterium]